MEEQLEQEHKMYITNIILFTTVVLFVNSNLVKAEDCNVGESQVENFEYERFLGVWRIVWSNSDGFAKNYNCWNDEYKEGPELNSTFNDVNNQQRGAVGSIHLHGTEFTLTYPTDANVDEYSGKYNILATDYDKYAVVVGCAPITSEPNYYVQYRNLADQEETKDAVEAVLKKHSKSLETFYCNCNCK